MSNTTYSIEGTAALQNEYICDIPWEKSPVFVNSSTATHDIEVYRKMLEMSPQSEEKIKFSDNVWKFAPFFKQHKQNITFTFTCLPADVAEYCKFYVLHKMTTQVKIQTIMYRYKSFASVYSSIVKNNKTKNIYSITTQDIIDEVERRNIAFESAYELYEGCAQIINFLINNCHLDLATDLQKLRMVAINNRRLAAQINSKLPNIPEEYFNSIYNKAIFVMRDVDEVADMRMTAAALVLLSQLGLRISEILALKTDSLLTKKLKNIDKEVNYIHYVAFKPSRPGGPLLEFDIYCTPIAAEAFSIMKQLGDKMDVNSKENTLFVLTFPRNNTLPYTIDTFYKAYKKFMYKHLQNESSRQWEGISPCKHQVRRNLNVVLYIPDTRQYRVHLCSSLYEQGVDLLYIRKYMGHLSESMMGYYVRPKNVFQEDENYTGKIIKEIVEEDLSPLGGALIGEEIKTNIKKFIQENHLNVHSDINSVVKALGDKVVIRGKPGGVCIKTSLIPCSDDARTDKIMCAHSICPNLFHFYYMLDITYLDFQTLQQTYYALKKAGNKMAAEKELRKAKDLLQRRLMPELEELEAELNKKGYNAIIAKHPSLIEIIDAKDEIRREVEEWKTKEWNE